MGKNVRIDANSISNSHYKLSATSGRAVAISLMKACMFRGLQRIVGGADQTAPCTRHMQLVCMGCSMRAGSAAAWRPRYETYLDMLANTNTKRSLRKNFSLHLFNGPCIDDCQQESTGSLLRSQVISHTLVVM